MTSSDTLEKSTESHRFSLAVLFIGGFLAMMFAALFGEFLGVYSGLGDLVATFSGWITAVIGFYFLQQNTDKAQQQTIEVTRDAADSRRSSERAAEKTAKLTSVSESSVMNLKETIDEQKEFILELVSKLEELGAQL